MKWLVLAVVATGCLGAPEEPFGPRRDWQIVAEEEPPGRMHGAKLTYDAVREAVVMYTGRRADTDTQPGQVWMWKNSRWERICTEGTGPPPLYLPAFTWEPKFQQLVLVGGAQIYPQTNFFGDVSDEIYTCDEGNVWTKQTNYLQIGRVGASLLYQPEMDKLVLVGGRDANGQVKSVEISDPDASNFDLDGIPMTFASAGAGQSATYDDDSKTILALETELTPDDTLIPRDAMWKYDGVQWTKFCDDCSGTPRSDASLVHFGGSVETYLIGGYVGRSQNTGGTWILDHERFVKVFDEPSQRNAVGAAYNSKTDTLFAYGGTGNPCPSFECPETFELVVTEPAHAQ
jgi:hypothetical protein